MVEIPNEEYRDLSDRLKELLVKLSQHLKLLEDMRKKAFELERLQKKKDSFFYTSIFLLEFSQFTSLLTFLRDLDAKLDRYASGAGVTRSESREEKASLVPLLPAVVYTAKAHGDYGATFVSKNVKEQTGYKPEDFIKDSKFWAGHLHPDDKKYIFAKLPCLVEKGHWSMQYRFLHNDRSYRWMFEEARMVYDNKGKPKEIVGYWADITGLKQADEELRCVFESSPNAITVTDLEGRITECNPATLEMHGFSSKEELIGKNAFDLISKKDHERAMQNLKKTLEQGLLKNIEYTFLTRDGREFPAELSASVVKDSSGKPAAFMAVTNDITERKEREKELRIRDNSMKYSISAMAITDPKGDLEFINEPFLRMWKYDNESDVLGKSVVEFWKNRKKASGVIETLKEKGRWEGKLEAQGKDGSIFEVYVSASVATNKYGDPIGLTASFIDQEIMENIVVSH